MPDKIPESTALISEIETINNLLQMTNPEEAKVQREEWSQKAYEYIKAINERFYRLAKAHMDNKDEEFRVEYEDDENSSFGAKVEDDIARKVWFLQLVGAFPELDDIVTHLAPDEDDGDKGE